MLLLVRVCFLFSLLHVRILDGWETRIRHHRHQDELEDGPNQDWTVDPQGRSFATDKASGKHHQKHNGPVFRSENNTAVFAHAGSITRLPCQIFKDSNHGVITWGLLEQLGRPYTLLTVGDTSYTDNLRFAIEKPIRHDHWNLLIKPVMVEDSGFYECQATIHPPQSIIVKLVVLEAFAEIIGTKEKVFKSESNLQLVCALKKATAKPEYIFWYHNNRMINYDKGISVVEDINGSTLTISSVSVDQSGNYTCQPSNMKPDSVVVTILQESKSANALQDKLSGNTSSNSVPLYVSTLLEVLAILASFM